MESPSLAQLPPPPPGRSGWPWTVDNVTPDDYSGGNWPRISVVTASFNQGQYLEQTIRSILLQGYPNLEYFIMDGGSRDNSVEIIKKYEPWLAGWVSRQDGGQPDAINQGWKRSTGSVLAWLNSDDWYYPRALHTAGQFFRDHPEHHWFASEVDNYRHTGEVAKRHHPKPTSLVECLGRKNYGFHQPGMFWSRELVKSVNALDADMQYSFTHDFWVKCLLGGYQPFCVAQPTACFRLHPASKSCSAQLKFAQQDWVVLGRYQSRLKPDELRQAKTWLREYQADGLLDTVYTLLAAGKRGEASRQLLGSMNLYPAFRQKKLLAGLLYRTLVTGKPPGWFGLSGAA